MTLSTMTFSTYFLQLLSSEDSQSCSYFSGTWCRRKSMEWSAANVIKHFLPVIYGFMLVFVILGWKSFPRTNTLLTTKIRNLRTKKFYNIDHRNLKNFRKFYWILTMFKNNLILHYKISNRFFDSRAIYWIKHFYYGECH